MTDLPRDLSQLLQQVGESLSGFEEDSVQAEAEAIIRYTGRPYCLVRDWTILEVDAPDDYRASLAADGLSPHILYAGDVVLDCAKKLESGDQVLTTFQCSFKLGYLFETDSTTYVLMGPGFRKRASFQAVMAIDGLIVHQR